MAVAVEVRTSRVDTLQRVLDRVVVVEVEHLHQLLQGDVGDGVRERGYKVTSVTG